jgi:nucleotide-binding universal stress UspA family protein
MYRRIVVPVDGSAFAEATLPLAASLARLAGARVDLVQVLEPFAIEGFAPWHGDLYSSAREYLEQTAESLREAGAPEVVTHLLDGSVVQQLRGHVDVSKADLLMLATHGRGALSRAWLGSVADRLVRSSPVPVLLVRPVQGKRIPVESIDHVRRVLVPLDGSAESECVLAPVSELAAALGAELTLLEVVELPVLPTLAPQPLLGTIEPSVLPALSPPPIPVEAQAAVARHALQEARAHLADLAALVERNGVQVRTEVLPAENPALTILEHARRGRTDLIAMSTHGRSGLARALLGSVADRVVRSSQVPVLVFPPSALPEERPCVVEVPGSARSKDAAA